MLRGLRAPPWYPGAIPRVRGRLSASGAGGAGAIRPFGSTATLVPTGASTEVDVSWPALLQVKSTLAAIHTTSVAHFVPLTMVFAVAFIERTTTRRAVS